MAMRPRMFLIKDQKSRYEGCVEDGDSEIALSDMVATNQKWLFKTNQS